MPAQLRYKFQGERGLAELGRWLNPMRDHGERVRTMTGYSARLTACSHPAGFEPLAINTLASRSPIMDAFVGGSSIADPPQRPPLDDSVLSTPPGVSDYPLLL